MLTVVEAAVVPLVVRVGTHLLVAAVSVLRRDVRFRNRHGNRVRVSRFGRAGEEQDRGEKTYTHADRGMSVPGAS
jgi:hypothetical protein